MTESTSLFTLQIDPLSKSHLSETAKWARFLAIVGFVFLGLMIIGGIYSAVLLNRFQSSFADAAGSRSNPFVNTIGVSTLILYIIIAVVGLFPLLFMLRFANAMKLAIASDDQALLNTSFQNLKKYFRYVGIITVMFLVLMAIMLLIGIVGAATV